MRILRLWTTCLFLNMTLLDIYYGYGLIYSVFAYISEMLNMDFFSSTKSFVCEYYIAEFQKKWWIKNIHRHANQPATEFHITNICILMKQIRMMVDKQTSNRNLYCDLPHLNMVKLTLNNKWTIVFNQIYIWIISNTDYLTHHTDVYFNRLRRIGYAFSPLFLFRLKKKLTLARSVEYEFFDVALCVCHAFNFTNLIIKVTLCLFTAFYTFNIAIFANGALFSRESI